MKKLISFVLVASFFGTGAIAKSNTAPMAAATAAIISANNQAVLNNQTAISLASPSYAEAEGMTGCSIDRVEEDARDAFYIKSDPLANLAWAAEKSTNFGRNFEDTPITANQLLMIRSVQNRAATKGSSLEWLSIHETLVLCESGFKLLDQNIIEGRGGW